MAKLVPHLEAEDFHVLPPARVSVALEPKAVTGAVNPYVASLIYTWEEERPKDTPPLADLTGIDLNGYLTQRSWIRSDPRPVVLILDQFEEILTRDQQDWNAKGEFFRQLGLALQNRERWAVIAMREEHIAGLDPYLDLLPTRLATRYRLELLSREKAREAIAEPARSVGVTYHAEALGRFVSELTAVGEPSADVYYTAYVEPLHLQVVCNRLWQRLPDGTAEVGPHLVDTAGTVGEALAGYYRDTVHSVAQTPVAVDAHCDEKRIRDWLENELISSSGLRDQLQRGASTTGSLPNPVVDALEERYLLRFELRRGTPWYEIAHDRLIEAIKADNQAWYETHPEESLRLFWDRGKKWQGHLEAGRSDQARAELLTGKALAQVESWVARHARPLSAWD